MTKELEEENFLLYTSSDGQVHVRVLVKNETIWLSQKNMAELFDCSIDNISLHLKNIFKTVELSEKSVVEDFSITASDKKKYKVKHYNLDAIISVGYRVHSIRGTQFRIWATQQLKDFLIKGFVLDENRLKNPQNPFGKDYFDELLEKIRDIRSSERRFYQKITDIYATSIDYHKDAELTQAFFATVQNKMHYGIHGKTAAEVIAERANAQNPGMGITCIPQEHIKKSDIFVAKNYLTAPELEELNLIVDQYLSFAELQAKKGKIMTMKDWVKKLDDFLIFNEKEILQHKGSISKKLADNQAAEEYEVFRKNRTDSKKSDFDRLVQKFLEEKTNSSI